ncbi:hypothetical protein L210DRAFT_3540161 [Boletus edulis BED1]|uniref:Uncharacterized protein n=1 Tax=Boletus edulis BED1 TaxID=1328754 RepID=A0AAD4GEN4_BOLED|nr:hypothetical protein L210DRAFT_3540161 [Boletus edulis BED1]
MRWIFWWVLWLTFHRSKILGASHDVWAGPLTDGSMVSRSVYVHRAYPSEGRIHVFKVLVNWMDALQSIMFDLSDVGVASAYLTDPGLVLILGRWIRRISPLSMHTARLYTSSPTSGGATRTFSDSSITVLGYIGFTGTLTSVDVGGGTNGGTKLLMISYVNADSDFSNTDCSNCRRPEVSAHGGTPVVAVMPLSRQSWDVAWTDSYLVRTTTSCLRIRVFGHPICIVRIGVQV